MKKLSDFYDIIINVCLASFGIWAGFLFILFGNRAIEEFSLGIFYEILLVFGTIGFTYLILSHYRFKKEVKTK